MSCEICFGDVQAFHQLHCNHSFCLSCLTKWIRRKGFNATCPFCRAKLFAEEITKIVTYDLSLIQRLEKIRGPLDGYALYMASEDGYLDVVRYIMEQDRDIISSVDLGLALSVAFACGHLDIAEYLAFCHTADIYVDLEEELCLATERGDLNVVEYLLSDLDADIYALVQPNEEYDNKSALQVAEDNGHFEVVKLITDLLSVEEYDDLKMVDNT